MNILEQHGARPQKEPRYVPLFIDRAFTGLFTQRSVLHDPSDMATKFYAGGRPDALWMGKNIELTNWLTLMRRFGHTALSAFTYPSAPLRSYSFQLTNGLIQLIVDTGTTGALAVTSVSAATPSAGLATYNGTFPGGANNAYAGMTFKIVGFVAQAGGGNNDGTFTCVQSTTTTLVLQNGVASNMTQSATATSSGAVYYDQQNGNVVLLWPKTPGAGQTNFQAVNGVLYFGNGIDTKKYTPSNSNATTVATASPNIFTAVNSVWNWGIAAPIAAPTGTQSSTGAGASTWQAATEYLTMGTIWDNTTNNLTWSLVLITGGTTINGGTIGTSSNGQPNSGNWNFTEGSTTTETSGTGVQWKNAGIITAWRSQTFFDDQSNPTAQPTSIYDPASGTVWVQFSGSTSQSGGGRPRFFNAPVGTVLGDNDCRWVCQGRIGTWPQNTVVSAPPNQRYISVVQPIPPPGTIADGTVGTPYLAKTSTGWAFVNNPGANAIFLFYNLNTGTTGSAYSNIFGSGGGGAQGTQVHDGQLTWQSNGTSVWTTNLAVQAWSAQGTPFSCMVDSFTLGGQTTSIMWVCTQTTGATAPSGTGPFVQYHWQNGHVYTATQATFIIDTNGNKQQVTTGGTSGASQPPWNKTKGGTTTDNTVTWTNLGSAYGVQSQEKSGTTILDTWFCVGIARQWSATTKYFQPTAGWVPPSGAGNFGSPSVNDLVNGNAEFLVNSGLSGATIPTFSTASGGETLDGSTTGTPGTDAVWYNNGAVAVNTFSYSKSHAYAFAYKARSLTDLYSVAVGGVIPVPPGEPGGLALPPPTGSQTGGISTASPANVSSYSTAANQVVNHLTGVGSQDPQVDTIVIFRDADGQGPASMIELTEIPNTPNWSYDDFQPDTSLNSGQPAPINHQNDPPPAAFLPMAFNFQRIWGSNGLQVPWSGGPDIVTGNPNEAFKPSNELPFLAPVIRIVRHTQGLIVFLTSSIETILGGPSTTSFYSATLAPGVGLVGFNALDVFAGEIYFFAADSKFYLISPSLAMTWAGFPVGDQLANLPRSGVSDTIWNPATVYVAVHQNSIDNCVFLADGSTGWYRLNPHQVPGVASGPEPIWSPFAAIVGGAQMVQSVELTPGIKKLVVGSPLPAKPLLIRNLSVFTDNGQPYDAQFTMGAIMLANPGQLALLKFIEADFSGIQFKPTISYLLNELSGTFTPFTSNPVFDPPSLYGFTIVPKTYSPNRYYFASNASLARCRFLQINVDFGKTANPDEIYNLTIYGGLVVEL
jgi:hypothetical protein